MPGSSATGPIERVGSGEALTVGDRLEIHELAARYGTTIDDRDWTGLESVFSRDAVYELRGFHADDRRVVGSAAIRRMMEDSVEHPVAHHVTNVIVSEDGGVVRMRSKVIGSGRRGRVGSADYTDVVRREDGAWRIAHRVVELRRPDGARQR
jgi:3-phenylpropionate/cinnamic acid dioxygenase small subunit